MILRVDVRKRGVRGAFGISSFNGFMPVEIDV